MLGVLGVSESHDLRLFLFYFSVFFRVGEGGRGGLVEDGRGGVVVFFASSACLRFIE